MFCEFRIVNLWECAIVLGGLRHYKRYGVNNLSRSHRAGTMRNARPVYQGYEND